MCDLLLSVIVPVYNTERWLRTCLNSISSSTFKQCEFIIVNDGSTDGSNNIINEFLKKDSRFRLISQENNGLSDARNKGLVMAKGQYVLFVDSDDYINFDCVMDMLTHAIDMSADIVVGRIRCIDENEQISSWGKELSHNIFPNGAAFMDYIYKDGTYFPMVFGYLIRKELIYNYNLYFHKDIIHEDELWTPIMLLHAQKTIVLEGNHYKYRINRTGSIMSSHNCFERIYSLSIIICCLIDGYITLFQNDRSIISALPFIKWRIGVLYAICNNLLKKDTNEITEMLKDFSYGHLLYFNQEVKNILQ